MKITSIVGYLILGILAGALLTGPSIIPFYCDYCRYGENCKPLPGCAFG